VVVAAAALPTRIVSMRFFIEGKESADPDASTNIRSRSMQGYVHEEHESGDNYKTKNHTSATNFSPSSSDFNYVTTVSSSAEADPMNADEETIGFGVGLGGDNNSNVTHKTPLRASSLLSEMPLEPPLFFRDETTTAVIVAEMKQRNGREPREASYIIYVKSE
jgi:hypothetical protein